MEPTIEIRNKRTGEVKNIPLSQAGSFGIPADVALTKLESQRKLQETVATGNIPTAKTGTSEQQFKQSAASRAVSEMEKLYGRGSGENVGTEKDLSLSPSPSGISKSITGAKRAVQSFLGINKAVTEDVNKYKAQRDIAIGMLTQAFGSGTPQEGETQRLIKSAPTEKSTDAEAKQWFESVRNLIGADSAQKALGDVKKNDIVTPTGTTQDQQPTQTGSKLKSAMLAVGNAAPVALGTAAGVGGSILGGIGGSVVPGAGTAAGVIVGGGAGTAIGTGAGVAIQNMIQDIAGEQDESSKDQLLSASKQAATAGILDVATAGLFKAAGSAGNLILKSASKFVDDIPLKSIRINPSQISKFVRKHGQDVADFMIKNNILGENSIDIAATKASKLQDAFDNLAMNENITIPVKNLKQRFADEIRNLAGVSTTGVKEKIVPKFNTGIAKSVLDEWDNIMKQLDGVDSITPKQLTEFRRMIDEVIPDSQFIEHSVKNVAVRLRRIMNDTVQEGIDKRLIGEAGGQSLKQLGGELSKYYDFLEIAEKQSGLGRGNLVANLPRILSGSGGGAIGGMIGGVPGAAIGAGAGLAIEELLKNPEVLKNIYKGTQTAKKLYKPIAGGVSAAAKALSSLVGAGGANILSQ